MSEQFINKVFDLCVDILLYGADILGMTYNEINIWLFVIIQPLIHIIMVIWIFYLIHLNKKLKSNIS